MADINSVSRLATIEARLTAIETMVTKYGEASHNYYTILHDLVDHVITAIDTLNGEEYTKPGYVPPREKPKAQAKFAGKK